MSAPLTVGRYVIFDELAAGGMATVHLGRLLGPVGFARTVAVKRLHPQFARDPEFVASFLDEARLAARIAHPNVVPTLDVVATSGELFLVMEYVQGESLHSLVRTARQRSMTLPIPVVAAILVNGLAGLHAAHEATDSNGEALQIVHRDVSPQNFLVGADGITRVLDFGIAKAAGRSQQTRTGVVKGKLAYMPPEQVQALPIDRRVDIYAAGVVLWEMLAGVRCFQAETDYAMMAQIFEGIRTPPSTHNAAISPALDAVVMRACALDPDLRYPTAEAFAQALEDAVTPASPRQVSKLVESLAAASLAAKLSKIKEVENSSQIDVSELGTGGSQPSITVSAPRQPSFASLSPASAPSVPDVTSAGIDTSASQAAAPPARSPLVPIALAAAFAVSAGIGGLWSYSHRTASDANAAHASESAVATPSDSHPPSTATPAPPFATVAPMASATAAPVASAAAAAPTIASTASLTRKPTTVAPPVTTHSPDVKKPVSGPASDLFNTRR